MRRAAPRIGAAVAILTALAVAGPAAAEEARLIENPILRGFNPDPCILRVADDYYIATSTFEWHPGVRVHHSRDLRHWRLRTHLLTRPSQIDQLGNPSSGGVWAPALSFADGVFYLVYTDVKNCSGGFVDAHNYLIAAPSIDGPWSDPVALNSSGFDPSLFHDDDGRKWLLNMVWDHVNADKSAGIVLQEYSPLRRQLVGDARIISRGMGLGGAEGPHLYKLNGWYYLVLAEGGTGFGHALTMARARRIEGPYELDPGNPVLTARDEPNAPLQKVGHASLVQTQAGEWFLAFLCGRPLPGTQLCNLGRETALARGAWNEDGWLRLAGGGRAPSLRLPGPLLAEHRFAPESVRDEFDAVALSLHFNTLRAAPDASWLSLSERPGYLRMYGRESLASRFRQSLVARRLQAFRAEITTRVEFEPETFQQMAGLVCYYDERNFVYLRLSRDEKLGLNVGLYSAELGKPSLTEPVAWPADAPCHLRARFDCSKLEFFASRDRRQWQPIGAAYDAGKLSDDFCRGFTGTFVGLAVQDLSGRRRRADFDFFEYRELDETPARESQGE